MNLAFSRWIALGMLGCVSTGHAASFDCHKATTPTETLVCGSPRLSVMDSELGNLYRATAAASTDERVLRDSQSQWLRLRRNSCQDEGCLIAAYSDRIAALNAELDKQLPALAPALEPMEAGLPPASSASPAAADKQAAPTASGEVPASSPAAERSASGVVPALIVPAPAAPTAVSRSTRAEAPASEAGATGNLKPPRAAALGLLPVIAFIAIVFTLKRFTSSNVVKFGAGLVGACAVLFVVGAAMGLTDTTRASTEAGTPGGPSAQAPRGQQSAIDGGDWGQLLAGKWSNDPVNKSACGDRPGRYTYRDPDGKVVHTEESGRIFLHQPWTDRVIQSYGHQVGLLQTDVGGKRTLWAVKVEGSEMVSRVLRQQPSPANEAEALAFLNVPESADPLKPTVHRLFKCSGDYATALALMKAAQSPP
jgi:uncharacterized protein